MHAGRGGVYYRQRLSGQPAQTRPANDVSGATVMVVLASIAAVASLLAGSLPALLVSLVVILAAGIGKRTSAAKLRKQSEAEALQEAERRHAWEWYVTQVRRVIEEQDFTVLEHLPAIRERYSFIDAFDSLRPQIHGALGVVFAVTRDASGLEAAVVAMSAAMDSLGVPENERHTARQEIFKTVTWVLLSDNDLTEEEDAFLLDVMRAFELRDYNVEREFAAISQFRRLRELGTSLPVVDADINMQKSEQCHHVTKGALMEQRVERTWVEDGEKHKEYAWVKTKVGDVYITSKRVLIVGDGSTSIPHDKVLDVDVDVDSGRIEIVKDGRKASLFLAVDDPIFAGAIIERAMSNSK